MKYLFFLLLTSVFCLADQKETFDKTFSVTFPDGWKKYEKPQKGTLVYRESASKDASFAIAKLKLPKNSKADLTATVNAMIDGMKKNLKLSGDPKMTPGKIDGKNAVFARVMTEAKDGSKTGFFIIAIDAKNRVFMLQATLPNNASGKSRQDCMKIIQSFREDR